MKTEGTPALLHNHLPLILVMTGAMLLTNKIWQRNIASMITFFKTVTTVLLVDSLSLTLMK